MTFSPQGYDLNLEIPLLNKIQILAMDSNCFLQKQNKTKKLQPNFYATALYTFCSETGRENVSQISK